MSEDITMRLRLQLFADGGDSGDGTGEAGEGAGAADAARQTGEDTVSDAERHLLELGVPADKARRHAERTAKAGAPRADRPQRAAAQTAEQPEQTPEPEQTANARMTWDEIMADPEYNAEMQKVVQARLKSSREAAEKLSQLAPALEVMARQYGMDPEKLDYKALSDAVENENLFYESRALELGSSVEEAKRIDQAERLAARQARTVQQLEQQRAFEEHIRGLERQAEALRARYPAFDLRTELDNPVFARMTAPGVGLSVEDAFYAVHRAELQAAENEAIAERMAQKLSNSVRSGMSRPRENGTSAVAPSATRIDWTQASSQQREALKKRIYAGEKILPGREF